MSEQQNKDFAPFTAGQIDELTAIYKDYLYFARQHEKMMKEVPIFDIVRYQMENIVQDRYIDFPWQLKLMSYSERKHFDDFLDEKIHTNTGRAYITLQHINPEENKTKLLEYVPQPYFVNMMDMPLPSAIERYVIVSPEDAKIGNTEFYVDGFFKAVYTRKEEADKSVFECLQNPNTRAEFRILINIVEMLRKYQNSPERRCYNLVLNVFAEEGISANENTILEILSSFAEKLQQICRTRYKVKDGKTAFELAQKEGLIASAENFSDYVNIRNLLRHQWDSMDELGYFCAEKAEKNTLKRSQYIKSFLKLCDKTLVQRMKSYVEVLHQMQQLIYKLKPDWVIRNTSESNSRFAERVKALYRQNPSEPVKVEINHPQDSDKYRALHKNLHKVAPNVVILDDFSQKNDKFSQMTDDYGLRTFFLQTYHSLECRLMTYCITRGHDLKNRAAWDYMRTSSIFSEQESQTWHNYTELRKSLSHNYFSPQLRQQLRDAAKTYFQDLDALTNKILDISPEIRWVRKGIYEYIHKDGKVVRLDFENRKVLLSERSPQLAVKGKIELTDKLLKKRGENKQQKETYHNGFEITTERDHITDIKLPCGVGINLEKQRVVWDTGISLHTNAEKYNALQTANCKLIMDKDFRVTEYMEKNRRQPVRGGDILLLDHRHRTSIDAAGRLSEFRFKNNENIIKQTSFRRTKDGVRSILFADGTLIMLEKNGFSISHNGRILSYENRREFATSYDEITPIPPQFFKGGNGR